MCEISIIIPIYNGEKYIENCIESILNQSFKDFELILINDGSTDNSQEIVERYQERYNFIRVYFKENGGVSSARNLGIQKAKGKFITCIDSDDEIREKYLEVLHQACQYDYVVSGIINRYINDVKEVYQDLESVLDEDFGNHIGSLSKTFFVNGFIHSSCGKLYKTEILQKYDIRFPNIRLSEDSMFNILYLQHVNAWKVLKEAQYIYMHRSDAGNATSIFREEDIEIYIELHNQMRKLPIKKAYVDTTLYAQYLAICIKVVKQNISDEEKKIQLKKIMKKKYIRKTLLFSPVNKGEWITGILLCLGNMHLINLWMKK